ncbi:chemotaxis protein CheA [Vogesella amnigena]|uniref:Chemotaxis protein CheA n=1 Tax=Vogesella amnigena TaxID=1507449 RepID=A0ABV7TRD6_9NEIS
MMEHHDALTSLVQEARELLTQMEAALLEIEEYGVDDERINAVFRAAHTIKGSAGLFALDLIVDFTHVMESVLVQVRNGELALDGELSALLLGCGDYLAGLINVLEEGDSEHDPAPETRTELLAALGQLLETATPVPAALPGNGLGAADSGEEASAAQEGTGTGWQILLQPSPDLLRMGMDPLSFILYLERLGRLQQVATQFQMLPSLQELDPERCYLSFSLQLLTSASRESVLQAFEFIIDDCDITLTALPPDSTCQVQEVSLPPAVGRDNAGLVPRPVGMPSQRATDRPEQTLIKIEARKLDQLIDAVGEMVIATAGTRVLAARGSDGELREALAELELVVERIRDRALELRMTPIGDVFQRFPRVVRDVSKELGKKIELVISGAETELDKSMVEKLSDPLLHIVRNALDHGIEPTSERLAAGKPEHGRLQLNAYHESGSIVVEISDDGRGLNKSRIFAKAVEKGLIAEDAQLSDEEIFNLIFAAGFSTAEQVTDISGRGVGMDVVRQNISQLRGSIQISSQAGMGSTFRIQLPLTLAIIDGFQVLIGGSSFILPLDMVEECVDVSGRLDENHVVSLRGEPLPIIDLEAVFDLQWQHDGRQSLVVVRYGQRRAGILVDRFVGEMQAVIKPLGQLLQGVRGLGGFTILGDGQVALILDVPLLVRQQTAAASHLRVGQCLEQQEPKHRA